MKNLRKYDINIKDLSSVRKDEEDVEPDTALPKITIHDVDD